MKTKFNEFLNENKYNTDELLENCEWLKNLYSDYEDVRKFFTNIENELYNNKFIAYCGLGFCNESKSQFTPLNNDIASYLIKNDFILNIDELEKSHQILYFQVRIEKFRKYLEERPFKKYYYYKTIKQKMWDDKYTIDEKIQYIKDLFEKSNLKDNYNISINSPVSFINVDLVEK